MSLASYSVRQPVLVNLLTVMIIAAGAFIYTFTMRKEVFPEFQIPYVLVSAIDVGSGAEAIERNLTIPIENEIARVDGIKTIDSVSTESRTQVVIELEANADIDKALLDLKSEADKAQLPAGVDAPQVTELTLGFPVISFGLYADPAELGLTDLEYEHRLKQIADDFNDDLSQLAGVDSVSMTGLREREISVETTPARLAEYALSNRELASIIAAADTERPGGTLESSGGQELILRAGAQLGSVRSPARDLEAVIVRKGVPLARVAEITDGFQERTSRVLLWIQRDDDANRATFARPAVQFTVFKQADADTIKLADRLREYANEWRHNLPDGFTLSTYSDYSVYIRNRVDSVENNGMIGLVIVLIVLVLFLNYRFAFMTALGIPISIFGAIAIMAVMGYSANLLSLFGLIVALGLVVDDAIIICENAYRYIERGMSPAAAAIVGTREVFWPVVASVLTTTAAFLPLLLWGGITGKFMSVIPIAVCIALAMSLVEALLILPAHVAEWSHRRDTRGRQLPSETTIGRVFDFLFGWTDRVGRLVQGGLDQFRNIYTFLLRIALRRRYITCALGLGGFFTAVFVGFFLMDQTFFDMKQTDRFTVKVELPRGTPLADTEAALVQLERIVRDTVPDRAIMSVQVTSGMKQGATRNELSRGKNLGMVEVEIIDSRDYLNIFGEPAPENFKLLDQVYPWMATIRAKASAALPTAEIEVIETRGGPPAGRPLEVRLRGDDTAVLTELAEGLKRHLQATPGVTDISDDLEEGTRELRLKLNEDLAALHGVDDTQIATMVAGAFDGVTAVTLKDDKDEIDVVVRFALPYRDDKREVLNMDFMAPDGTPLKLGSLVSVNEAPGFAFIKRYDRKRTVTVTAGVEGVTPAVANAAAVEYLAPILADMPGYSVRYGGEFSEQQESQASLGGALLLALFCIYVILATVLRSFIQPLLIMSAVPFGLVGVVFGLYALGENMSTMAMIGLVAVTGVVVNDSTVLVAFINNARRNGASRWMAIIRGCRLRLRPILLTTLTTIGGLLSLSFSHLFGVVGQETFLAPMGIAIIFGLAFSTGLMLLIIPALYAVYEDVLALFGLDPAKQAAKERAIQAEAAAAAAVPE